MQRTSSMSSQVGPAVIRILKAGAPQAADLLAERSNNNDEGPNRR
jgi:hypothetical protein